MLYGAKCVFLVVIYLSYASLVTSTTKTHPLVWRCVSVLQLLQKPSDVFGNNALHTLLKMPRNLSNYISVLERQYFGKLPIL